MTTRRGFALLATLWLMVAIAAASLQWTLRSRNNRLLTLNAVDLATATAAAESGLAHARSRFDRVLFESQARLRGGGPARRLDPWSEPQLVLQDTAGFAGPGRWHVEAEDHGVRLDLNEAREGELRRLLVALRVDPGRADRIAQSITDWRDPDHAHRPRGAESDWYVAAGRHTLPRNGPFQNLSELAHVRELDPALYERVRPFLSLNGPRRVNLMAAPRPVLLALPGVGQEVVAALERRRLQGRPLSTVASLSEDLRPHAWAQMAAHLPYLTIRTSTETQELLITSKGGAEGSAVRVTMREVLVRSGHRAHVVRRDVEP